MRAVSPAVLRAFVLAGGRLSVLFGAVFYGLDFWTAARSSRWRLHFDWELALPYWPWAYPIYNSVLLLPLVVLAARNAEAVRRWERTMAATIVLAGLIFAVLPAQLGYAPVDPGSWQTWADWTRRVAGRHNLLPSLHVALSVVTLAAVWPLAGRALRLLCGVWFASLLPSVLVTHQHHVLDVLAGLLLAAALLWRMR